MLFVKYPVNSAGGRDITLERFADVVDAKLADCNVEYQDKRKSGRLSKVRVETLLSEQWVAFTSARQARGGGSVEQYKHPCLLPDPEFSQLFLKSISR